MNQQIGGGWGVEQSVGLDHGVPRREEAEGGAQWDEVGSGEWIALFLILSNDLEVAAAPLGGRGTGEPDVSL